MRLETWLLFKSFQDSRFSFVVNFRFLVPLVHHPLLSSQCVTTLLQHLCMNLFKIVYGLSDLNFTDYFISNNCNYSLRCHPLQIKCIKNSSNQQWQNSFFYRVVKIWNSLPEDAVQTESISTFKSKITTVFLSRFTKLNVYDERWIIIQYRAKGFSSFHCHYYCVALFIFFLYSCLIIWFHFLQTRLLHLLISACHCYPVKDAKSQ